MSEAKEYISGFTPKVIVSGIILSFLLGIYFMSIPQLTHTSLWGITGSGTDLWNDGHITSPMPGLGEDGLPGIMLLTMFVVSLVSYVFKFSRQEVACLFTILIVSHMGLVYFVIGLGPASYFLGTPAVRSMVYRDASPLIYPKNTAAYTALLAADVPFNLDAWGIPLVFATLFQLTVFLFIMFLMSLVRRLYIDVEALPYPLAAAENELIGLTQPESESKTPRFFRDKLFWIGFVPTFLLSLSPLSSILFPGTKAFWLQLVGTGFKIDLTPLALLPWVPIVISYSPIEIAFGYMLPMNVLMTVILTIFIFWFFVPPMLTAMALLPPFPVGQGAVSAGTVYTWLGLVPQLTETITLGIMLAIAIYPLWAGRETVVKILKGLAGKVEGEEVEAFNYRVLWAGTIVLGILLTVELIALGMAAWIAPITVIWLSFIFLAGSRLRGEAGVVPLPYGSIQHHLTPAGQAYLTRLIDREGYTYFNSIEFGAGLWNRFPGLTSPLLLMEGFKLGAVNKVRNRDIFLFGVMATLIIVPVASVSLVLLYHKLNLQTPSLWPYLSLAWVSWTASLPYTYARAVPPPNNNPTGAVIAICVGAGLILILYFIRAKSRRFRLVPAAVLLGLPYFMWSWLVPYIIAYVLKFITLKVWGVEAYQNKGLRIATGLFVGPGLGVFLSAIATIFSTLSLFGLRPLY